MSDCYYCMSSTFIQMALLLQNRLWSTYICILTHETFSRYFTVHFEIIKGNWIFCEMKRSNVIFKKFNSNRICGSRKIEKNCTLSLRNADVWMKQGRNESSRSSSNTNQKRKTHPQNAFNASSRKRQWVEKTPITACVLHASANYRSICLFLTDKL